MFLDGISADEFSERYLRKSGLTWKDGWTVTLWYRELLDDDKKRVLEDIAKDVSALVLTRVNKPRAFSDYTPADLENKLSDNDVIDYATAPDNMFYLLLTSTLGLTECKSRILSRLRESSVRQYHAEKLYVRDKDGRFKQVGSLWWAGDEVALEDTVKYLVGNDSVIKEVRDLASRMKARSK